MLKLTHDEKMNKVWSRINQLPITTDEKKYETDPDTYFLVRDITEVRDAFDDDLDLEEQPHDEDLPMFFDRHDIWWK